MKRKRFRVFMVSFIVVVTAVLSAFMISNLKDRKQSNSQNNPSSAVTDGTGENYKGDNAQEETGFTFYVNESAVKKTKTTTGEITTFVLEVKLFITNKSSKTETIDPDAFALSYDTEGKGLLFSVDYGDIEKPIILDGKSTTSINFVVTYLIQDVENFNDFYKHNLTINYVGEQILLCSV